MNRGSVIWKGEWTASSKIKRGNEYIWSGFVKAPFSGGMELALCRPSRFHGAFCYYYNQSPCCPLLSSCLFSGRVLIVWWWSWGEERGLFIVCPQKAIVHLSVRLSVARADCHACSHQGREIDGHAGEIRSGGPWKNCGNTTCETDPMKQEQKLLLEQQQQ